MARMLANTSTYTQGCGRPNRCCQLTKWMTHHGRTVGRLRKTMRAKEKDQLRREREL